jgi:hypothetical protein
MIVALPSSPKGVPMAISAPEDEPNGYSPFDEPVYVFTDKAIVPPLEDKPPEEPSHESEA